MNQLRSFIPPVAFKQPPPKWPLSGYGNIVVGSCLLLIVLMHLFDPIRDFCNDFFFDTIVWKVLSAYLTFAMTTFVLYAHYTNQTIQAAFNDVLTTFTQTPAITENYRRYPPRYPINTQSATHNAPFGSGDGEKLGYVNPLDDSSLNKQLAWVNQRSHVDSIFNKPGESYLNFSDIEDAWDDID